MIMEPVNNVKAQHKIVCLILKYYPVKILIMLLHLLEVLSIVINVLPLETCLIVSMQHMH